MKKVFKSRIFIVIITLIIGTSLGVYAGTTYPYQARDVVYNSSDGTSMNVNDALNSLYSGQKSATVVVSVYGVGGSSSFVGSRTYTLSYPNTGTYSQGDGDTKVIISWK